MALCLLPGVILGLTLAGTPSFALATQAENLGIDCKKAISTPDVTLCINDALRGGRQAAEA